MTLANEEFAKVIDELQETGINISKLSEDMGLSRRALHSAKRKERIHGNVSRLASIIKAKAKLFQNYRPNKYSIDFLCREGFVKRTFLAGQIGISRQALSQAPEVPHYREEALTKEVHSIGNKLQSLASRLEKIKE